MGDKKSKEEILNQDYITATDLKLLIPTLGINQCRDFINMIIVEMQEKGYYVPNTIPKLVLTKLVRKKLGI